jgi:uncharacterized protein involved in exopolysaccharide biosynthesis
LLQLPGLNGESALSERDNDNEEPSSGRPGRPVDPLRIWHAIRSRWQLIAIAGVLGAFLGAAVAKKFVSKRYGASSIITWNVRNYQYEPEEREAIVESVLFAPNLEEVRKRMKLGMPTGAVASFVRVAPSQRSNNIAIESEWETAEGAAQLVNTVVDVFLDWRQKIVSDRLRASAQRYRDAVAEAEKRQLAAAAGYDAFRRESGITDISQERELAITQAAALSAQADSARAQAETAKRQLDGMKGDDSPEVQVAAMSDIDRRQAEQDQKRLPEARGELERAKLQFSSDHPQVRRLEAELEALEARVKSRGNDPKRRVSVLRESASAAEQRQRVAESFQAQLRDRLNKLSAVEGRAAVLLGEMRVSEAALEAAKALLAQAELEAQNPPSEFRVLQRASPPEEALSSPRKRIAMGIPIGFTLFATLASILWSLRRLDVRTPKEAAFWSNVPVVGASTWPRDPDMLSSLMHDLDDYAPHCEGVTLIVGASLDEAHLARRVAEWDGHRMVKSVDHPERLLTAGPGSKYPLVPAGQELPDPGPTSNMQILTLTGPVPAQALRRAARLADRVLVVVQSGKHSIFQMMKIRGRLGRDAGIGLLLVGLDKEYALVRDRVGEIDRFWHATRAAGS